MPSSLEDGRLPPLDLPLAGERVLIVEDVFLIADASREIVEAAGAIVLGPYSSAKVAFGASYDQLPTLALLDLALHGEPCFQLADALASMGVPLVFLSSYAPSTSPDRHASSAWLEKPSHRRAIVDALVAACVR